jgi:hypothetical protein
MLAEQCSQHSAVSNWQLAISRNTDSKGDGLKGPGGIIDSSPPLQWRVTLAVETRAVGTLKRTSGAGGNFSVRPYGTGNLGLGTPGVETPGYYQTSLRVAMAHAALRADNTEITKRRAVEI